MTKIIRFSAGDILELKKPHPCGCSRFSVLRTGSEVRIVCLGCGRDMTMGREKLERAVKRVEALSDFEAENCENRKDGKI